MIYLFFFEVKNLFKQKKTWIIMGILCILSVFLINDFNNRSKIFDDYQIISVQSRKVRFEEELSRLNITIDTGMFYRDKIDVSNVIEYRDSVNLLLDSLHRQEISIIEKDWETYHKEQLFYDYWYVSNYLSDITNLRNQKLIDESLGIFQLQTEVKKLMNYPDLNFSSRYEIGMTNVMKDFKYFYKNHLLYSYHIVKNEIYTQPVHRYTMNGSTFIYHFFAQFWIYIFVLQILLNFNEVYDSRNYGSSKLIYTLPYKKSKIILAKLFISIFSTLIVILVPLILVSFILYIQDGFSQMNFPVLVNSIAWNSFTGIENNLKNDLLGNGGNFSIGISYFSSYPRGSGEMHALLDFIKLIDFYGLSFILFIFNLAFLSSIILLVTQIVKQKILAFIALLSVFGIGVFISRIDPNAFLSKLNPFSSTDIILLNGGTSTITWLNSIIVLSISTCILLVINQYLSKKSSI